MDKLGVFHANQKSMCLDQHLNKGEAGTRLNQFKPSSKMAVLLLWIICVNYVLCL